MDELLDTLVTREAHNLLMRILLEQEQNLLIASANFISEVWSCIAIEVNYLREQKVFNSHLCQWKVKFNQNYFHDR